MKSGGTTTTNVSTTPTSSSKKKGVVAATKLKRPRTKAFLERSSYHHSIQRSCAFLEREVELLCANESSNAISAASTNNTHADEGLRIQQQQLLVQHQPRGSDSTNNVNSFPSLALPLIIPRAQPTSREGDIRLMAQSVNKHRRRSKQEYISYRDALKLEAQTNIRLFESFQCITKSVVNTERSCDISRKGNSSENKSCCPLLKLNQGLETTQGIHSMVSQFAGVPTKVEFDDWKELISSIAIDEAL